MRSLLDHSNVQKLKSLLFMRYGKGLRVSFLMDVSSIHSAKQSPSIIEGDLHIPLISRNGDHLASIKILGGSNLPDQAHKEINDLVYMMLEPVFYNWMLEIKESSAWVYDLNPTLDEIKEVPVLEVSTRVMFLESKKPSLTRKVVDELHQLSGAMACLPFELIRQSGPLAELESTTIVVNDILHLSHQDRLLISDYLNQTSGSSGPLIIIASSSPLRELKSQQMVEPFFLPHLQKCILDVEKLPLDSVLLREALELFLEPGITI